MLNSARVCERERSPQYLGACLCMLLLLNYATRGHFSDILSYTQEESKQISQCPALNKNCENELSLCIATLYHYVGTSHTVMLKPTGK